MDCNKCKLTPKRDVDGFQIPCETPIEPINLNIYGHCRGCGRKTSVRRRC